MNGNIQPIFRVKDGDYQFSWSEDKNTAKTGSREIRIYDEEQYANFRKAQRAGETPSVKPLSTIYAKYAGKFGANLLFVSSEFVVLASSLFVAYIAFQNRMKLVS